MESSVLKKSDLENVKNVLLSKHLHQHEKQFKKSLDVGETKILNLKKSVSILLKTRHSNESKFILSVTVNRNYSLKLYITSAV